MRRGFSSWRVALFLVSFFPFSFVFYLYFSLLIFPLLSSLPPFVFLLFSLPLLPLFSSLKCCFRAESVITVGGGRISICVSIYKSMYGCICACM